MNKYDCLCPSENGPVNWGHCGMSFGDGRVIHAWDMVRVDDYLAIEKLTAFTGDHPKYLGWVRGLDGLAWIQEHDQQERICLWLAASHGRAGGDGRVAAAGDVPLLG